MNKFIFTNEGLEYAAKTATGSILVFTKGKFGDGTAGGDISKLTDLVKPLGELQISKKSAAENQVTIETQFTNTTGRDSTLPAFHLKEIGLFAKLQTADGTDDNNYPETLVCYAHAEGSDIGDYIPETPTEFIINWPFSISNADNVKVTVGLGAFALQLDLDSLEEGLKAHKEKTTLDHPDGSVTTAKIKDYSVTNTKIANGAINHVKLAENSVWETHLGSQAVSNDKIANDAVTFNKIQNGAVLSEKIADGAVTENKIHDRAVTEDKIAGGAVTHVKLASDSVWEAQLGNQAVTTGKIKDAAVTARKLDSELNGKLTRLESMTTLSSLGFTTAFGVEVFAKITNPKLCAIADVMFCRHVQTGMSVCGRARFQMYPCETEENENGSIIISDVVGTPRYAGESSLGIFYIVKHNDGTYYLAFDNSLARAMILLTTEYAD